MPDKPTWAPKINDIAFALESLPESRSLVSATDIQQLLEISPRQAQDLLKPIITEHKGKKGLAPRECVIRRLRELAGEDLAEQEKQRLGKVADWIDSQKEQLRRRPRLLVEAPLSVMNSKIRELEGVQIDGERIIIEHHGEADALEKLLKLAMAVALDEEGFRSLVEQKQKNLAWNENGCARSLTLDPALEERVPGSGRQGTRSVKGMDLCISEAKWR